MTLVERKLSPFEHALTLTNLFAPFNIVGVLELEPLPSSEHLVDVLAALQKRHPLLNAAIHPDGKEFRYVTQGVGPVPVETVDRPEGGSWRRAAEHELNTRLDSERGPLLKLTRVVDPSTERGELVITSHHAINDGVGMLELVSELLACCRALREGKPLPELPSLQPAPPLDALFPFSGMGKLMRLPPFMFRQMTDELRYRLKTRGVPKPVVPGQAECRILPVQISAENLTGLGRLARKQRTTPHAMMHAAMLLAVDKHLYGGNARALRGIGFADLRPFLNPPVSSEDLGSYISMMRYTAELGPNTDFWDLARNIGALLYKDAKRGDKFLAASMTKPLMRMMLSQTNQRMAAAALSFMDKVPLVAEGPVRLHNLHGFVSNIAVGPQFTALARIFRGALWWDFLYMNSDMDETGARAIAQDISNTLTALS
ncbi:MAG: condensation domain-containing protein [Acidobacteriota bacterium]|nr:condensation domain-containing protein [Acidobacteriota bacterium]